METENLDLSRQSKQIEQLVMAKEEGSNEVISDILAMISII